MKLVKLSKDKNVEKHEYILETPKYGRLIYTEWVQNNDHYRRIVLSELEAERKTEKGISRSLITDDRIICEIERFIEKISPHGGLIIASL